ncbi:MAG TPA: permease [Gemmatimonadaceae bacterium]|nr:permease [Gemmatimonadaceae bacterium]
MKTFLLVCLGAVAAIYLAVWLRAIKRSPGELGPPTLLQSAIGFVTNFFDTLGIGAFAPTTALFRMWRIVPVERIPGTLNVGSSLPAILQAFIYIAIIEVDALTLVVLIAAAALGAWLGAGVVSGWPRRRIQIGMGLALLAASGLLVAANLQLVPGGGAALTLRGPPLLLATVGNFMLGALMTLGIGLYAPCLIMLSLLGMNTRAVFPIMMGSCAFLMPTASIRFIREGAYSLRPALGLAIAGIPAVLLAAYVVKSLPLTTLRWVVAAVVSYTSVTMLVAALRERGQSAAEGLPAAE